MSIKLEICEPYSVLLSISNLNKSPVETCKNLKLFTPSTYNPTTKEQRDIFYSDDINKYFEEFVIPDIYSDKNVMIRLYFIIGNVGTFLLSKNHFYHTIHPLKNEDDRYVWVSN